MEQQQQRSGFWSSLPGILTGSAALITAATGGYLAFDKAGPAAFPKASPEARAAPAIAPQPAEPVQPTPAAIASPTPGEPAGPDLPLPNIDPPSPAVSMGEPRPSFDCARASTTVETMICADAALADRDRQVAAQYFALRGSLAGGMRGRLLDSQRLFLRQRSDCRSSGCLAALYDARLRQLAEY